MPRTSAEPVLGDGLAYAGSHERIQGHAHPLAPAAQRRRAHLAGPGHPCPGASRILPQQGRQLREQPHRVLRRRPGRGDPDPAARGQHHPAPRQGEGEAAEREPPARAPGRCSSRDRRRSDRDLLGSTPRRLSSASPPGCGGRIGVVPRPTTERAGETAERPRAAAVGALGAAQATTGGIETSQGRESRSARPAARQARAGWRAASTATPAGAHRRRSGSSSATPRCAPSTEAGPQGTLRHRWRRRAAQAQGSG